MKRLWLVFLGILFIVTPFAAGGPAFAWEFSMDGGFTWEYKLYSQMGTRGFFGPFDIDNAGVPDAASLNGWLGNEITAAGIASGSDVSAATIYASFNPEVKICEGLYLRGCYYIGAWDQVPIGGALAGVGRFWAPEYFNSLIPGLQSSFSPGYWNTLWLSARTPWGHIVVGKRPFSFGTGLIFDGEDNATIESITLVAPYGPLRLGFLWFPWRRGLNYPVLVDKNAARQVHVGGFLTYENGPLSMGALVEYARFHRGPESAIRQFVNDESPARVEVIPEDQVVMDGNMFVKYFNGRFFFNAEVGWINSITKRQRNALNTPPDFPGAGSPFRPTYVPHWRALVETGTLVGPSKLSLLWAWIEGPDRRHGILNDRNPDSRNFNLLSNFSVFRPYSILLSWDYGSGNNSLTAAVSDIGSDNGYITDANVYAARYDYAAASNLNVYASFIWAERLSHGYGWGYISPGLNDALQPTGAVDFRIKGDFAAPSPAIPDNSLGWEVDLGFDWKLLEGYIVSAAFGYWKPGKWFNYACVDRANPGWKTPNPGNNFGINPNREIDGIFGMDLTLVGEF